MTSEHSAQQSGSASGVSRRHALTTAATVGLGVPLLAACGEDDGTASDPYGNPQPGGTSSGTGSETPAAPADGLVATADVPVGGGVVFPEENVVVVQPAEGEFLGWSATCTHQGCTVTRVEEGRILCPCHNSSFAIEDGSPQGGPAQAPLEEVDLTVDEDSISLA